MTQMKAQVQRALNNIRPYLQADNGDIELIDITEDGIVTVKFLGACKTCPLSAMTLRAGVERTIMKEVPSVKRIEATS